MERPELGRPDWGRPGLGRSGLGRSGLERPGLGRPGLKRLELVFDLPGLRTKMLRLSTYCRVYIKTI